MVTVIGAGLAGCEAAWQCAARGVAVRLCEQKPLRRSPAHHIDGFAELVCSNSLRGDRLENAPGLLKEELRRSGSLILAAADRNRVPAGGALAVDRQSFSDDVTAAVRAPPLIAVEAGEADAIPADGTVIVATGPLTDGALSRDIVRFFGGSAFLRFYDAAAPIVAAESIDMEFAYRAARYGRGGEDYINCPMDRDAFDVFREALANAREAPVHGFEDSRVFEGCMPVEVMARRGKDTLRFGSMRPVGLKDPRTGKGAYAVLQLRRDNAAGSAYNMVGFQTHLLFPEQKRVFSMIPALRNAEFLRYGVMHRNSFIDSPRLLKARFEARQEPRVLFAGQLTGVEGYVESTASGLVAGICAARRALGKQTPAWHPETAIGALCRYISTPGDRRFEPMNINFALLPPLPDAPRDKQAKNRALAERALSQLTTQVSH